MFEISRFAVKHPAAEANLSSRGVPSLLGACASAAFAIIIATFLFEAMAARDIISTSVFTVTTVLFVVSCILLGKAFVICEQTFMNKAQKTVKDEVAEKCGVSNEDVVDWAYREVLCCMSGNTYEKCAGRVGEPFYVLSMEWDDERGVECVLYSDAAPDDARHCINATANEADDTCGEAETDSAEPVTDDAVPAVAAETEAGNEAVVADEATAAAEEDATASAEKK